MNLKAKLLNHHEPCEHDKDLATGTRHELQRIIQPVAFAQHHTFVLNRGSFKLRIGDHRKDSDDGSYSTAADINDIIAQPHWFPQQQYDQIHNEGGGRT